MLVKIRVPACPYAVSASPGGIVDGSPPEVPVCRHSAEAEGCCLLPGRVRSKSFSAGDGGFPGRAHADRYALTLRI